MTDDSAGQATPDDGKREHGDDHKRPGTKTWVAAAGIGSAALVAALMYANRGRGGRRED